MALLGGHKRDRAHRQHLKRLRTERRGENEATHLPCARYDQRFTAQSDSTESRSWLDANASFKSQAALKPMRLVAPQTMTLPTASRTRHFAGPHGRHGRHRCVARSSFRSCLQQNRLEYLVAHKLNVPGTEEAMKGSAVPGKPPSDGNLMQTVGRALVEAMQRANGITRRPLKIVYLTQDDNV